jgi:hypothetical protein
MSKSFASLAFYHNGRRLYFQNSRKGGTDSFAIGEDFGFFAYNNAIKADKAPSRFFYLAEGGLQQNAGVRVLERGVSRREQFADVSDARRAEQRVRGRVAERVSVRMTELAFLRGNLCSAEQKTPPWNKPMYILS